MSGRASNGSPGAGKDGDRRYAASAPAGSPPSRRRTGPAGLLEVAAQRLLALDRLEQRLEVALAEGRRSMSLDHLEEDRRPVLRRLGEDLQEIPVLVTVDEDLVLLQDRVILGDLADPILRLVVVRVGRVEEKEPALLERLDGAHDVRRRERDVLRAGAAPELDVLLDLALALALGRLVDRELDLPLAVRHDLRHQRRVLRLDLLVAEVEDVRHPEDALVELDPVVHPAELDVADDVVDVREAYSLGEAGSAVGEAAGARPKSLGVAVLRDGDVTGEERAAVVRAVDEGVDRVAVGRDRRALDRPVLVLVASRLHHAAGAARHGLAVGLRRVGHSEGDVADAVAVSRMVLRDLVFLPQRPRNDETHFPLLEHVGRAVADSRLGAGIRRPGEAHGVLVEVRRLLRVADPELDVIPPEQRHEVFGHEAIMPLVHSTVGARTGGRRHTRSYAIPAKMRTPPAISSVCRLSPSSTSAKKTAKNGCRFPNSAAREGPTRSIAVNQRMFVRKSGPTTA